MTTRFMKVAYGSFDKINSAKLELIKMADCVVSAKPMSDEVLNNLVLRGHTVCTDTKEIFVFLGSRADFDTVVLSAHHKYSLGPALVNHGYKVEYGPNTET